MANRSSGDPLDRLRQAVDLLKSAVDDLSNGNNEQKDDGPRHATGEPIGNPVEGSPERLAIAQDVEPAGNTVERSQDLPPIAQEAAPRKSKSRRRKKSSRSTRDFIIASGQHEHLLQQRTEVFRAQFVATSLHPNGHDQWPLPPPEPIMAYGVQIWPTADRRYDWRAAYYGYQIWRAIEEIGATANALSRGHKFRNPLGPLQCHADGPIGIVIQKIGDAMIDHPDQHQQTQGPGKILQGR
jgi:hypothetical protein